MTWDASQIKQPGWHHVAAAFIAGAREARANPQADDAIFLRSADAYSKQVFEEVDPESERRLRTGDFATPPQPAQAEPSELHKAARPETDWSAQAAPLGELTDEALCVHCGKELCNDLGWCNDYKPAKAKAVKQALLDQLEHVMAECGALGLAMCSTGNSKTGEALIKMVDECEAVVQRAMLSSSPDGKGEA